MIRSEFHLLPLYFSALKIFAVSLAILIFYFLPSLWYGIAKKMNKHKLYIFNFLFGWSVIGWWWCWELAASRRSFNSGPYFKRAFIRSLFSMMIVCGVIIITTIIKLDLQPNAIDDTQITVIKPSWMIGNVKSKIHYSFHEDV
ncbi:superinfection immunity protein [Acidithiobacillus sp.]|uniref:superinfection immunity protein n=1 Tax=Acidithiobacillus sp. TaxID=1872118 RepID=UPI00345B9423